MIDSANYDEEAQQSIEQQAAAPQQLPKTVSWTLSSSTTASISKRCIPKKPRTMKVCARLGCCIFVTLALLNFVILFLVRLATSGGCGIELSKIEPVKGGLSEDSWTSVHWLGMRNFGRFIGWVPPFRNVKWAARPIDSNGQTVSKRMAFTFDDAVGSNATAFNLVLDYLSTEDIKATFFVIADEHVRTDEGKAALKRAVAEGHQLGNHGVKNSAMAKLSFEEFTAAIDEWETVVSDALDRPWPNSDEARWFRPPQGLMSGDMNEILLQRGYSIVLGDLYSDDWAHADRDFHAGIIKYGAVDGSIAILHVMDNERTLRTLEIMEDVVPALRKRGFSFSRVDDMFKGQGPDSAPICADAPLSTSLVVICFMGFTFFFAIVLGVLLWDCFFCIVALTYKARGRPVPWKKLGASSTKRTAASTQQQQQQQQNDEESGSVIITSELPLRAPNKLRELKPRSLRLFGCCSFRRDDEVRDCDPDSPTSTGNPDLEDDDFEVPTVDPESPRSSPHQASYSRRDKAPPTGFRVSPA
eukprot:CAMPEP_0206629830 /NCGR_PEP_ID=MMETSP0325_2-20121206/67245_1 /ASSEMBLY_ACC=CAM_ASM_000347 /TAXON_ID=2866 /ORGANISM="Crypthecodinium cohnii, Strain Seligo" /LENGTH=527 /DNA_ID=CAMNT_0054154641 /DNA_START=379 /DNA_END=1962 /DNA_ORIENTATION=-